MISPTYNFEAGFHRTLSLWRAGETWEAISHRPEYDASAHGRGMFAAVEALAGWLDVARREAKAWGVVESTIESLILEARES